MRMVYYEGRKYIDNGYFLDGRSKTLEKYGMVKEINKKNLIEVKGERKKIDRDLQRKRKREMASKNCRTILEFMEKRVTNLK